MNGLYEPAGTEGSGVQPGYGLIGSLIRLDEITVAIKPVGIEGGVVLRVVLLVTILLYSDSFALLKAFTR